MTKASSRDGEISEIASTGIPRHRLQPPPPDSNRIARRRSSSANRHRRGGAKPCGANLVAKFVSPSLVAPVPEGDRECGAGQRGRSSLSPHTEDAPNQGSAAGSAAGAMRLQGLLARDRDGAGYYGPCSPSDAPRPGAQLPAPLARDIRLAAIWLATIQKPPCRRCGASTQAPRRKMARAQKSTRGLR